MIALLFLGLFPQKYYKKNQNVYHSGVESYS